MLSLGKDCLDTSGQKKKEKSAAQTVKTERKFKRGQRAVINGHSVREKEGLSP